MTGRTLAFNLARALALGVASIVVAALVWRAQERAQPATPSTAIDPTTNAVGADPSGPAALLDPTHFPSGPSNVDVEARPSRWDTANPSFLPSSKSLTIDDSTVYFLELPPNPANVPPSLPTDDGAQLPPKQ